ncbi:MAG: hypothetical protein ACYC9H_02150 [Sulfuricaulis sp.]
MQQLMAIHDAELGDHHIDSFAQRDARPAQALTFFQRSSVLRISSMVTRSS